MWCVLFQSFWFLWMYLASNIIQEKLLNVKLLNEPFSLIWLLYWQTCYRANYLHLVWKTVLQLTKSQLTNITKININKPLVSNAKDSCHVNDVRVMVKRRAGGNILFSHLIISGRFTKQKTREKNTSQTKGNKEVNQEVNHSLWLLHYVIIVNNPIWIIEFISKWSYCTSMKIWPSLL